MVIWVPFPAQQALVAAVLRLCRIEAYAYRASLAVSEQAELWKCLPRMK